MTRLIDAEDLKKAMNKEAVNLSNGGRIFIENIYNIIDNAPTVEFNESVIQEFLNKRCMTAVANEYLISLQRGDKNVS